VTDADADADAEARTDPDSETRTDADPDSSAGADSSADADRGDAAARATAGGIAATYHEADGERLLEFERDGRTAAVAQNVEGYAMLKVRPGADGDELERYYGFDMALDHAAELLGAAPTDLPIPEAAADMGM